MAVGINPWAESMLQVPPELFAGVVTDGHLLTYDQEMIDRLSNDYGVFSPTGFRFVFSKSDGSEHYVIWDASSHGGKFVLRSTAAAYDTEILSRWAR